MAMAITIVVLIVLGDRSCNAVNVELELVESRRGWF